MMKEKRDLPTELPRGGEGRAHRNQWFVLFKKGKDPRSKGGRGTTPITKDDYKQDSNFQHRILNWGQLPFKTMLAHTNEEPRDWTPACCQD